MYRLRKNFKSYKKFMECTPMKIHLVKEDALCGGCKNHRPDWEYRFCKYCECTEIEGMKTFWDSSYREEVSYARGN